MLAEMALKRLTGVGFAAFEAELRLGHEKIMLTFFTRYFLLEIIVRNLIFLKAFWADCFHFTSY